MHANKKWYLGDLLAFDLETTGKDPFEDVPVSYAFVTADGGAVIRNESGLVDPGRDIPEEAVAIHGITSDQARAEGCALIEALEMLSHRLMTASEESVPVVGMNIGFDLTIIDVQSKELLGEGLTDRGFSAPVLDILVIDRHVDRYRKGKRKLIDLCTHYTVDLSNAHEAAADCRAAIGVLHAIGAKFPEIARMTSIDLHARETEWHRDWARGYDKWLGEKGKAPLEATAYTWPIVGRR